MTEKGRTRMDTYNPKIRQDYAYRDDRRVNGPVWPVRTIKRLVTIAAATLAVLIALALLVGPAGAQSPQSGYWEYQMTPEGMTLQNRAQGFGYYTEPRRKTPRRSEWRSYGAPRYYNERGQPSTVPDPRQYRDLEDITM